MANLLPEPGSNPRPFLSDEHLVSLGVTDQQSIVLETAQAQEPQVSSDDLVVHPDLHQSGELAERESDGMNFSLPYAKLKLKSCIE